MTMELFLTIGVVLLVLICVAGVYFMYTISKKDK